MFSTLSVNMRGMIAMTAASVIFVFSDVLAKIASQSWTVGQLLTVRGIFAVSLSFLIVRSRGEQTEIPRISDRYVLIRTFCEGSVTLLFISALAMMPIADLTSILMLSPLVITAIATLFLGEKVGWRRWSAIMVGFTGLVMVVQPGAPHADNPNYALAATMGLISVAGVAARDIVTRKIGATVPPTVLMLATAIGSASAGFLLSLFETWRPFAWQPFLLCVVAAVIVTIGNFFLIMACRGADLSVVAPFRYTSVVWSIVLGFVVFGDVPNSLKFAGMTIIVASGVYLMHRERIRQRELGRSKA